jgi:hypothetical protein
MRSRQPYSLFYGKGEHLPKVSYLLEDAYKLREILQISFYRHSLANRTATANPIAKIILLSDDSDGMPLFRFNGILRIGHCRGRIGYC